MTRFELAIFLQDTNTAKNGGREFTIKKKELSLSYIL